MAGYDVAKEKLKEEIKEHLTMHMIPFWTSLIDEENGGFYGKVDDHLVVYKDAVKGCILNSRILWFFSNAYQLLGDSSLLESATHAYRFLINQMLDKENGGVYWALNFDGSISDNSKHTYNQAFAIYALSSYYKISKEQEARDTALALFDLVESKCRDKEGYLEAFDRTFLPVENDKLSENGIIASKTMNTLLHVFEAYTELYHVTLEEKVADRMRWILDLVATKVYNKELRRQEVFFDEHMNSLIDLHSYGHDIEAAWLLDLGLKVLDDDTYKNKLKDIIEQLEDHVFEEAFHEDGLDNECEDGVADKTRIWWVQAETMVGYFNAFEKRPEKTEYLEVVLKTWEYCKKNLIDVRERSEWFYEISVDGSRNQEKNVVDMWKCPYHNGRMCFEMIKRV